LFLLTSAANVFSFTCLTQDEREHIQVLQTIEEALEKDLTEKEFFNLLETSKDAEKELPNEIIISELEFLEAEYHFKAKNDPHALELLIKYIQYNEANSCWLNVSRGYYRMAVYYFWNEDYTKTLEYAKLSLEIIPKEPENLPSIAQKTMIVGVALSSLERMDEALVYQKKSLDIKRKLGLVKQLPISLSNFAHANLVQGDTVLAIQLMKESIHLADSLDLKADLLFSTFSLGCFYYEQGNYLDAIAPVEYATEEWEKIDSEHDLQRAYEKLYQTYEALGQYEKANGYLNKYLEIRENHFEQANLKFADELEKKYQTEKKEVENLGLKSKNEIYKKRVNYFGIGIAFFSLLSMAIAWFYFQIRRVKTKLALQNETIERQNQQLVAADQIKSKFYENVSHELRTPLSLMVGPIEQLTRSKNFKGQDIQLLQFIKRNSDYLRKLLNEMLDLSKIESDKMELQEESFEFFAFLKNHVSQFYAIGESQNIKFSVDVNAKEDVILSMDKQKLIKVLNNLLSNAFKFNASGSFVNLKANWEQSTITILIEDGGQGIPSADLPHIFDRFYQSNEGGVKRGDSTGIGLSLCKELCDLMGMEIRVESEVNNGTKFYLSLPVKVVASSNNSAALPLILNSSEENLIKSKYPESNILVVEDHQDLREYFSMCLADYNVTTVENGKRALDQLNSQEIIPDLIISDLMMPVMDGMELLEHLKASDTWRNIPVIMLTAQTNHSNKLKALRIGIDDYMQKPFDNQELKVRINNLLERYKQRSRISSSKEEPKKLISISDVDKKWLESFEAYIIENLSNEFLSVASAARAFNMSESSLLRTLKRLTGLTPAKYLQEHKLNYSRELLERQELRTVAEVAYHVGFKDAKSFTRSFKQRFGTVPSNLLTT